MVRARKTYYGAAGETPASEAILATPLGVRCPGNGRSLGKVQSIRTVCAPRASSTTVSVYPVSPV